MTATRLNPTLVTEAYFSVAVEGDHRRTRFDLGEHPEIAPWLLSVLEFVLWKQGRLADERQISPPPGGATLQRLIEGRIVLAEQRADGGLALRLSPEMDLRLALYARRHRQPAINAMLSLAEEPDVTRWLLQHYGAGQPAADLAQLDVTLLQSLRRHGVLVDELPDAEAFYPDPTVPADLAGELAPAARIFRQSAGQPVPPAVRAVLGRHTPALPPGRDLLWSEDAGTGLLYPALCDDDEATAPAPSAPGAGSARRATLWQEQRAAARASLRTERFAELRALVPEVQQEKLRRYLHQLVERGYFPAPGDGQVERRAGLHNPATFAALHHGLARLVTAICGEPLIASYCYLGCYEEGAVLERHKDRPQCAYNLSLVFDMQNRHGPPAPWPIYLELDHKPREVLLEVGDGLLYSGTEIWHWRDALPPGQRALVCFYHFVPEGFTGSLD